MNIFILDTDPVQSAKWLCDKHVVKMVIETAQLLSSAHWKLGSKAPYKPTHSNHPCAVWARSSLQNYQWLVTHGLSIADEFEARYGKVHKTKDVLLWLRDNLPPTIPSKGLTPFAVAIKPEYQSQSDKTDVVSLYRTYYKLDKARFATWKRSKPAWW